MKASRRFVVIVGTALVVLAGISFHKVALAQSSQPVAQWMIDETKLPPDVHPDTLSRMPRPKVEDYDNDEEKAIFEKVMHRNPTQFTKRFLGPTGTRIAIAELTGGGDVLPIGESGLDPKYRMLAVEASTREMDNRTEFLGHEQDGIDAYGLEIELAIINRKDTAGMDPKAAAIIEFCRDLFKYPRTAPLSAKAYADLEKNFSKKAILQIVNTALSYDTGALEMRAYDQHMDPGPGCTDGCLDLKNPPIAWELPTTYKAGKDLSMAEWVAEQSKMPPDVHPDSLSRMPRPQESDYTSDKEKAAFNKIMSGDAKSARFLGPTGTLVVLPGLAQTAARTLDAIYTKGGVDSKYLELTIAVTTRETGDRMQFIGHEDDAIKAYGKKLEDVVRLRKSTEGIDDPKAVAVIDFGREIFQLPRAEIVSSKHFAELEQNFGKKGALAIIALMCATDSNWLLMRVYDQHMDTNADCVPGHGCLDPKNPPQAW